MSNLWIQLVSQAASLPLFSCSFDIQGATVDLPSMENVKLGCFRPPLLASVKRRAAALFEAASPVEE